MKFDLSKNSPYRIHVWPKLWFCAGAGASIAALLIKFIQNPDIALIAACLACLAAGAVLGFLYARLLQNKVLSNRQYLSCTRPSVVVWVLIIFCTVFAGAELSWPLLLCVLMLGYSAGFFWRYLPRAIEIRDEMVERMNRSQKS